MIRRNCFLIHRDEREYECFHFFIFSALAKIVLMFSLNSAAFMSFIFSVATNTPSNPFLVRWYSRENSRSRRFILFRATAVRATRFETTNARRWRDNMLGRYRNTTPPSFIARPCLNIFLKSVLFFKVARTRLCYFVNERRPLRLLRAITFLPPGVRERTRNPCLVFLFFFFGMNSFPMK